MTNTEAENAKSKVAIVEKINVSDVEAMEREVYDIITKTFQLYRPDQVFLSFNGGKDCTVVLHILSKYYKQAFLKHLVLPVLYIRSEDSFEETDSFVQDCAERYKIELVTMSGPMKQVLAQFLSERPNLKAGFMGCRRSDPYCKNLKVMQVADPGWPPLMRVNPLLEWTCRDVWSYIFFNNVPYCVLYESGYTSIGGKNDTKPNPYLQIDVNQYRPAYALMDDDKLERAGRANED